MTLWKAWIDVRVRFYLSAVLLTLLLGPAVALTAVQSARATATAQVSAPSPDAGGSQAQPSEEWGDASAFPRFADQWMHGAEHLLLALLAVVLSVGGSLSQANTRSNLMTLSLPVPRWKWLVSQWVVATLLVLGLSLWISVMIAIGGLLAHLGVSWSGLGVAWILSGLSAVLWAWPTLLSTSFTRESVRAALLVVAVIVAVRTITMLGQLPEWSLQNVADVRQWGAGVPLKPLLFGLAMTGASAWWVLRRFQRADF